MKKKLAITALLFPLSAILSQAQAESVSCVLENNKVITVSHLGSNPTYSYGTAGNAELILPSKVTGSHVYKGREMFSGGGSKYVAFTNGAYTYAVYSGGGRGWDFHGLRVYKDADVIMEKQCKEYGALEYDFDAVNAKESDLPY